MGQEIGPLRRWWTKTTRYEFWPFDLFYFPVKIYYAFLALKSRSFFFFTASNPSIDFGGMLGERKSDIFELIPAQYLPKTKLFSPGVSAEEVERFLQSARLDYPIIAKPNIGERGWMVRKLMNREELKLYLAEIKVEFLVQQWVDLPVELGVFYIKIPGSERGTVTSIVHKGFLSVVGDGSSSVRQLLKADVRAALQVDFEDPSIQPLLENVPLAGEEIEVEAIGNHCRGTTFLNANEWIDEGLNNAFNRIAGEIQEFYFGRFDLRCQSIQELKQCENFKILELNGAGSEPGHIYQPGYSIWQAYKDVCWHLRMLQKVSATNKLRGHEYWPFKKGWQKLKEIREYNSAKTS